MSMKKEIKNLKKALYAYQLMAKLPSSSISSRGSSTSNKHHCCMHCKKVFTSVSFLNAHSRRRHSDRYIEPQVVKEKSPLNLNDDPIGALTKLQQDFLDLEGRLRLDLECKIEKDANARKVFN